MSDQERTPGSGVNDVMRIACAIYTSASCHPGGPCESQLHHDIAAALRVDRDRAGKAVEALAVAAEYAHEQHERAEKAEAKLRIAEEAFNEIAEPLEDVDARQELEEAVDFWRGIVRDCEAIAGKALKAIRGE